MPLVVVRHKAFRLLAWVTRPLRRAVDPQYIYRFDLAEPVPEVRGAAPVEMSRATRVEVEEAARIEGRLPQLFLARQDVGRACFVAKVDGRIVSHNWTQYVSGEERGKLIDLAPGEIYTTDAITAEEFRGRKIHTVTLAFMLRRAQAEGYRVAYTRHSVFNRRARKTMLRLGWQRTGFVLLLRVPGGRWAVLPLAGSARPLITGLGPPAATA
jgi:GNAT superfamily N-acetyltransferase